MADINALLGQGYSLDPGSDLGNVLSAVNIGVKGFEEARQKKQETELSKQKYYFALRDNGYKAEEAQQMTEKIYGRFDMPKAGTETTKDLERRLKGLEIKKTEKELAKPTEWKPETEEEAIRFEKAKKSRLPTVRKMGNNLVQYDAETGKTNVIYVAPAGEQLLKNDDGSWSKYNKDTGKATKFLDWEGKPIEEEEEITTEKYTPQQEQLIQGNMKQYKKTREEVISAMKKKGLL